MQWAIGDGIRIGCVLIALNCPPGLLLDKQTKGIVPWSEQLNKRSTLNTAMYQVELPGPPLPKKLATVSEYIGNISQEKLQFFGGSILKKCRLWFVLFMIPRDRIAPQCVDQV